MRHMVWSILLLTLLCGVCSAATLSVDPAESIRSYGETVDLTVGVQDVSNLGGFDIDVTWKSSVVTLDTEPGNITIGPLFSAHVNHSAVNPQSGRIRVAGVNATLQGVSGSADLFTVRLKAVDNPGLDGASTPVSIKVNNYGFLNSTSGENITVSAVTNATIETHAPSTVDARIAAASSRVFVNQTNPITASVVNRRGVATSPLEINVSIIDDKNNIVFWNTTPDVTILKWGRFQQDIAWTPDKEGTYTAVINVTSDKPLTGMTNDSKIITAKEYTLNFTREISGPWDGRASAGSWFSMYAYVNASQSGYVWFNVTAPDHVKVYGAKNQTRYMYASDWNYVSATFWSDTPGKIAPGDITFEVAANGMTATRGSPEVLIWIPSIRVSSTNITSVNSTHSGELTFNTLHTNHTYDNVTKIIVQSGAQGRTLSGLEYLVGYPYGCVEQTTSKMLASLNVKNYYLERDQPDDWGRIRKNVNDSVEGGVKKLLVDGEVGQSREDGGWSLWGYGTSESSSSSYASYALARINMPGEDLNRLLKDKITNGSTFEKDKVNFESLIKWFHDNPDNRSSGTWTWSADVCHSWTPESNTAFVMLIHDMINQTIELDDTHRGYMEDNMRNATRYFVEMEEQGSWPTGEDQAMARALALWGLEAFAVPSEGASEEQIAGVKADLTKWLIQKQKDGTDGSWPAGYSYGWYYGGKKTEATAYAVLALNATGLTADNETIQGGVNWLINQYESGGGWGYTWASQVAIDALIRCQPTAVVDGTVDIEIDRGSGTAVVVGSFPVNKTHPRVEYTLNEAQMNDLMASGALVPDRPLIKSHTLTATSAGGLILVSVDHSQSAPINEIDATIRESRMIQSFGYEEEAGPLHVSTDIGILSDGSEGENSNVYDVSISSTPMVASEEAKVTITTRFHTTDPSVKGVYSPMIEIPIAGFTFDNASKVTENGEPGAFEYLNGTTGNEHPSVFIQSVEWVKNEPMTYKFKITPEDHGALDLDLRIRPLYDDTNVYQVNKTFTVMGRGNVSVNVVDEDGAPAEVKSITLLGEPTVLGESSHDFTGILEGNYTLIVNGTNDYPSIRTAARVTPDATALCNVTLPSSLLSPTLVFSEGGAGSIAGVAQVPPVLSADSVENTTYNVTVLGDGGEVGIALEFPMRYLMNNPEITLNGETLDLSAYEIRNGVFEYRGTKPYTATNATLIIYDAPNGVHEIGISFAGGAWGDADGMKHKDDYITMNDAMFTAQYAVGIRTSLPTYDYPDVANPAGIIDMNDAMFIAQRSVGLRDSIYQRTG